MADAAKMTLDELLCFTVYSTNNLINRIYAPHLKQIGLTYPQYLVLTVLWEEDHLTVGEIGKKLYLETNTLTPLLKRIEAQGLITRTRSKQDERQVCISLTKAGRAKQKDSFCIPEAIIDHIDYDLPQIEGLNAQLKLLRAAVSDSQKRSNSK